MANSRQNLLQWSVTIVFFLCSFIANGQSSRFQVWTDFNARFDFANKFQINVEPGYRIEPESGIQTGYLRGIVRYSPTPLFSFDLGLANFNVWSADIFNSFEFRTFQFAFLNWPELWDFDFKFRLGLEQRWFKFPELNTNEFVHRARFRIGVVSPYFDFWDARPKLFITTNFEVLRDINDSDIGDLVNENRLMIGIGYLDNKNFRGEVHYQFIGHRNRTAGIFTTDISLVRLRAFYYFRTG